MKILLINNGTKYIDDLKRLLSVFDLSVIDYLEIKSIDADAFDCIILSGSHNIAPVNFTEDIFKDEINLIKTSKKPIIGICYGFELIAHVYGCKLTEIPENIKTIMQIEMIEDNSRINVYENHHFAITELSDEIEGIAKSKYGYEIIKHKTKNIYGLQFHPEEFVDKTEGDEILLNIVNKTAANSFTWSLN